MIRLTFIFLLGVSLALSFAACSTDNDSEATSDATAESPSSAAAGDQSAAQGQNPNTAENLPWTFLTDGIYHNNATISVGSDDPENPNEGVWIDFKDNGTFDCGRWDTKEYDGSWYYDNNTKLLEMKPNGNQKSSEWRVMHKELNLVLVGTAKYGDNAIQARYVRRNGYPTKSE